MVNRPDPAPEPGKNQNALPGPSRRRRIVEDVFLVLAIFPLWPKILGWPGLLWDVILFADLVLLAVLLVFRWIRTREAIDEYRMKKGLGN